MTDNPKMAQIRALREAQAEAAARTAPKSSGGDVEGHAVGLPIEGSVAHRSSPSGAKQVSVAGIKPGPLEAKKGRPRIEVAHRTLKATRPWEKEGLKERTWYRRMAERAKAKGAGK